MNLAEVSVSATAEDTWSDPIWIQGGINASIPASTPANTVVAIQRSKTQDGTFNTVNSWTMDGSEGVELRDEDKAGAWYRIGVPTGGYQSGTVTASVWCRG